MDLTAFTESELLQMHAGVIDELITHRLKLEDINTGFELMKRGESIRSVVMY